MTKQFVAHIPAIKTFLPHDVVCQADEDGSWTMAIGPYAAEPALESDVIDKVKKATNWVDIKAEFFPMDGFSQGGEIIDLTPDYKQDF